VVAVNQQVASSLDALTRSRNGTATRDELNAVRADRTAADASVADISFDNTTFNLNHSATYSDLGRYIHARFGDVNHYLLTRWVQSRMLVASAKHHLLCFAFFFTLGLH
jgi:hypothetical protein